MATVPDAGGAAADADADAGNPIFLISDADAAAALEMVEDDKQLIKFMASEVYGKAEAFLFMAGGEFTFSDAVTDCMIALYTAAIMEDGVAVEMYRRLEDVCPRCTNLYIGVLCHSMHEDVSPSLSAMHLVAQTLGREMEAEAIGFAGRHGALVLMGYKLDTLPLRCLDGCSKETIDQIRERTESSSPTLMGEEN